MATPITFTKALSDTTTQNLNFRPLLLSYVEAKAMVDLLGASNGVLGLYVKQYSDVGIAQPITTLRYVLFAKSATGVLTPRRSDFVNVASISTTLLKSLTLPSFTVEKQVLVNFVASIDPRTRLLNNINNYLPFFIQQNGAVINTFSVHAPYLQFTGGGGAPGGEVGKQSAP